MLDRARSRGTATRMALGTVAAAGAAAAAWELARRRQAAHLRADPDREALTAPLPGAPATIAAPDGTRLAAVVCEPSGAARRGTVVLAHGWGMASRFWIHQLRDLAADHRVIAYDQRGHGASEASASGDYSLDALADDLRAVVDALVPDGDPLVVVGHSLGGMATLATGQRDAAPLEGRLDGAVLVDTAASRATAGAFAGLGAAEALASALGARALRARLPDPPRHTPLGSWATRKVALGRDASPSAVAMSETLFFDCPVDVRAALGATMASLDLRGRLPAFEVPTLVVVGDADRMTPPVHAQRLVEALPDARLVRLPGVGHQAPVERPGVVGRLVRGHVAEVADHAGARRAS